MHIYSAIRRTKENPTIDGPTTIRRCLYPHMTEFQVIDMLKDATRSYPGVWRIYRTVNTRNVKKAEKELADVLINRLISPKGQSDKNVESLWRTILSKSHNKSSKIWLIDLDVTSHDELRVVEAELKKYIREIYLTPNGYHLICNPFNPQEFEHLNLDIKRDGLVFYDIYKVGEDRSIEVDETLTKFNQRRETEV